jgi:hypothetical protein
MQCREMTSLIGGRKEDKENNQKNKKKKERKGKNPEGSKLSLTSSDGG